MARAVQPTLKRSRGGRARMPRAADRPAMPRCQRTSRCSVVPAANPVRPVMLSVVRRVVWCHLACCRLYATEAAGSAVPVARLSAHQGRPRTDRRRGVVRCSASGAHASGGLQLHAFSRLHDAAVLGHYDVQPADQGVHDQRGAALEAVRSVRSPSTRTPQPTPRRQQRLTRLSSRSADARQWHPRQCVAFP